MPRPRSRTTDAHARDAGCVGACHAAFMFEDTRGQECTGGLDLDEATCTAIELSACPGAAAPPLNGPSRELPGASLAPMAAPGTEVEALAAPSPLSGEMGDRAWLSRCCCAVMLSVMARQHDDTQVRLQWERASAATGAVWNSVACFVWQPPCSC